MKYESDELMMEGTSIVYFGAEWCGPCKMMGPIYAKITAVLDESVEAKCYKLDVDVEALVSTQFGVRNIPMIVKLQDGVIVNKHVGVLNESKLMEFIGNSQPYKII